jgi:hypothetical protein
MEGFIIYKSCCRRTLVFSTISPRPYCDMGSAFAFLSGIVAVKLSLNKYHSMSRMFKPTRIRLKARGKVIWMGLAMMVSRWLWLAGVVSRTHDTCLADRLLRALCERAAELEATCWCVLMGRPLTRPVSSGRFGTNASSRVTRKMTQGTFERANNLLQPSRGGTVLNTAFIERFNATMREQLATLIRKCRHAAHRVYPLATGMYLIGPTYNFCCLTRN